MDRDNDAIVRIVVADKSYPHLNNDLPRVPLQLWSLTLPTFPPSSPRYSHARVLNRHDNNAIVRMVYYQISHNSI